MSETNLLKLLEAGVLVLALGIFVWWQMRDLKRARQATARQRAAEAAPADVREPLDRLDRLDRLAPPDPSVPPRNPTRSPPP